MTTHEHFKKRVRARMAKTGERYGAARRALLDRSASAVGDRPRRWVTDPEFSDDVIRSNTGRGWDDWCDLIAAWPGHVDGHTAVAAFLVEQHGLDGWWSQGVTVGWERITGRRRANQRADGSFETSKTRTVTVDHHALRAALYDDDDRADLFPGLDTEMRSKPTTKVPRVSFPEGTVLFTLTPLDDGRVRINVTHGQLGGPDDVERWKSYWSEWLDAVDAVATE